MNEKHLEVGPLELEVLGILNSLPQQSVSDIQSSLKKGGRDLAYTTVMTVLVRLYQKEMLQRKKEGRQFLYSPAKGKNRSALRIFEKVKNSLFRAEKLSPILALLDSEEDLSHEELQELKRAVDSRLKMKAEKK
jgi:predicted transcriptional regulator